MHDAPVHADRAPDGAAATGWRGAIGSGRAELTALLRLAGPVVMAEIGWMMMGIVDTLMMGPLGPAALGGVGMGSSLFFGIAIFGMGLLLGLDTVVSHAFGAGDAAGCRRWFWQGLWLGLLVSAPLAVASELLRRNLYRLGVHPDVLPVVEGYLRVVAYSLWPLLLYAACRRFLQALGVVRPLMFALISANLVNAAGNWVLIYGMLGAPALGPEGAAWATVISRAYMALVLVAAMVWHDRDRRADAVWHVSKTPSLRHLSRLTRLGFPAATQITLEVGLFALASALAGTLNPASLAAHQIALNLAGFTFMVPLGVSSAAAVRVGHAVGRRDGRGVALAGWTAIGAVIAFMSTSALIFLVTPRPLLSLFTRDAGVLDVGVTLLAVAAMFQVFDGLQVVATGTLRGVGDTRTPVVWNLVGHWLLGLPTAWTLCFVAGWGVIGLWLGLSVGLIVCGVMLVVAWGHAARAHARGAHA
jgi:multidrug resistance protein, MATE family